MYMPCQWCAVGSSPTHGNQAIATHVGVEIKRTEHRNSRLYGRVEKRYLGRVHTPKIASSSLASATTGGSQALHVCGLHARYSRDRYGGLYATTV